MDWVTEARNEINAKLHPNVIKSCPPCCCCGVMAGTRDMNEDFRTFTEIDDLEGYERFRYICALCEWRLHIEVAKDVLHVCGVEA